MFREKYYVSLRYDQYTKDKMQLKKIVSSLYQISHIYFSNFTDLEYLLSMEEQSGCRPLLGLVEQWTSSSLEDR